MYSLLGKPDKPQTRMLGVGGVRDVFLKQPWEHREGHRAQPDFQIRPSGGPARGDQVKRTGRASR